MSASRPSHDALYGLATIARFIGKSVEETKKLIEAGELSGITELGTIFVGSKSALRAWRAERERRI